MPPGAAAPPDAPAAPPKIAIVGCGALGSFYGAKLCRSGLETHFLLRSDYDVVRRHGVAVRSPEGGFVARPHCARAPDEIGPCDWVVIGLKTTANHELPRLLPPLLGPTTRVVTLQNGLGNEARLAAVLGAERVFGGLCIVGLNRVQPGIIEHIGLGRVVLGDYQRPASAAARGLAARFQGAGVPCDTTDDLERARWEKLVWNVPFNGLGVAGSAGYEAVMGRAEPVPERLGPCLTTAELLADPHWEQLARELMLEVIAAANALGWPIGQELADEQMARTRRLGAYKASTLIDFERGQPLELESLFLEPLRRARSAGVPTPRLAALCHVLSRLDPGSRAIGARSDRDG